MATLRLRRQAARGGWPWCRLLLVSVAMLGCWLTYPAPRPRGGTTAGPPRSDRGQAAAAQGGRRAHLEAHSQQQQQLSAAGLISTASKWAALTDVEALDADGDRLALGGTVQQEVLGGAAAAAAAAGEGEADRDGGGRAGGDNSGGEQGNKAEELGGASAQPEAAAAAESSEEGEQDAKSMAQEAAAVFAAGLRCPPLTQELVQARSRNNTVMLGVMNAAQQDFGLNWLRHVQRLGIDYFLLGAADANTSALLQGLQVPCFDFVGDAESGLGTDASSPFDWGAEGWRRMTWHKVLALDRVAVWGFNVVVSDMDVAWLRDPLPLFGQHPHADVLFSTDGCGTANAVGDEGLEQGGTAHHNFNTGVYLLRSTPRSAQWVRAWRELYASGFQGHDQEGAYKLARVGAVQQHPEDSRLTTAWNESLYLGILPSYSFANGHTYMVQRLHEAKKVRPYEVHLTWTYNGMGGKRARLRDGALWFDNEEYYSLPSFVTVDLNLTKTPAGFNSLTAEQDEEMISFHLDSISSQLRQAYVGMALAVAAKRAFISPKFQCHCEKIWYAVVRCRVVDAQDFEFPITCPTDYLFQPDHFGDAPGEHGPALDFREPSLLDNPRTPPEVKSSVLVIRPSTSLRCADCVEEQAAKEGGATVLLVPAGLRDQQLLSLLEPYSKYRVWRLSFGGVKTPAQAFGGFACRGAAEAFDRRMDRITTDWCCRREEEAAKLSKQVREQLMMARGDERFSARPGLEESC